MKPIIRTLHKEKLSTSRDSERLGLGASTPDIPESGSPLKPLVRKLHKDGSLTIPKAMREQLGWKSGDRLKLTTGYPVLKVNGKWWIWLRKAA